jgi:enoyl-[acyl-carrier-protein] reductase (NADH)
MTNGGSCMTMSFYGASKVVGTYNDICCTGRNRLYLMKLVLEQAEAQRGHIG